METIKDRDSIEELRWLIQSIPNEFGITNSDNQKTKLLLFASCSLVRLARDISQGILTLLESANNESALMLERNLYELWCEFRCLINNSEKGAAKMYLNSIIEVQEFYIDNQEFSNSNYSIKLNGLMQFLESEYPEQKGEVLRQRKDFKFHWSGMNQTKMVKSVASDDTTIYKFLSWETHSTLTPLNDILKIKDDNFTVGDKSNRFIVQPEGIANRTTNYLLFLFNEFAETFELEEIDLKLFYKE